MILTVLALALAGGLGAGTRFTVDTWVRARTSTLLPVGTLLINLSGSLLLGLVTGLMVFHAAPTELALIAGTGFLGGYTTFSTASIETVRLIQSGRYRLAAGYGLGTMAGVVIAAGLGLWIAYLG